MTVREILNGNLLDVNIGEFLIGIIVVCLVLCFLFLLFFAIAMLIKEAFSE